ncbi:MAG: cell division ATP-binding protein FtsE [Deltaproteobacteria bacterium]|nr:cell division ATP-binding protein FtsE [Deltaproteobacteria bacterium]
MIEVYHLTKVYERGDRAALTDVSLSIERGEFVFLTGPSGAGKSTLLKLVFAAEPPSNGQILVNGQNVALLSKRQIPFLRRQVGVVFQDFKLVPNRTVFENVAYTLRVLGMSEERAKRRVTRILEQVGLSHKQRVLPQKLSGGEQQRVAIARALVNDPLVLLADEPTGNLDKEMAEEIFRLLEHANARGTTVVVATHDFSLMQRHPKRVVRLEDGRVVATESS